MRPKAGIDRPATARSSLLARPRPQCAVLHGALASLRRRHRSGCSRCSARRVSCAVRFIIPIDIVSRLGCSIMAGVFIRFPLARHGSACGLLPYSSGNNARAIRFVTWSEPRSRQSLHRNCRLVHTHYIPQLVTDIFEKPQHGESLVRRQQLDWRRQRDISFGCAIDRTPDTARLGSATQAFPNV